MTLEEIEAKYSQLEDEKRRLGEEMADLRKQAAPLLTKHKVGDRVQSSGGVYSLSRIDVLPGYGKRSFRLNYCGRKILKDGSFGKVEVRLYLDD